MSKEKFLALAKNKLKESQYNEVKQKLASGQITLVRYIIEDEYDTIKNVATELVKRGETDEVISQRMRDMQSLYNEYMENIELK